MQVRMTERLIQLRQEQGLSQSGLAEALGVSRQAVSRWETGAAMPSAENLFCLSRLYGVPMDELIRGEEAELDQKTEPPAGTQDAPKEDRALRRWRAAALVLAAVCVLLAGTVFYMAAVQDKDAAEEVVMYEDIAADSIDDSEIREFDFETGW